MFSAEDPVAMELQETAPDLPTQLTLHFNGRFLLTVDAVLPSGETTSYATGPYDWDYR